MSNRFMSFFYAVLAAFVCFTDGSGMLFCTFLLISAIYGAVSNLKRDLLGQ